MNQNFLDKLNEWYGEYLQRYEVIRQTESEVILFVECRDSSKNLIFEIARIFNVGNTVQISVDETTDDGFNMDSVLRLIKTVLKVG